MDELHRKWAKNIRRGREILGMTQFELAEAVGVRPASVCRWEAIETGKRATPTDAHKLAIAAALHQDVDQLFPLVRTAPCRSAA